MSIAVSRIIVVFVALSGVVARAAEPITGSRLYNPVQRMTPARLKAVTEDSAKLQATRKTLPAIAAGLRDYRVIMHAHAEDSSHTGGTRPEMLAEAKKAGVHAIILSDHYRPPRDFVTETWRGFHDGVLFLPGSEERGFLLAPSKSILDKMKLETSDFVKAVTEDEGLIFLSHIEERVDHPMDGLNGLEIYNRHYDAKVDKAGLLSLVLKMTDPTSIAELQEGLKLYPDALFAAQCEYPQVYLDKWDAETKTRRLTGVAANDCHHNMVLTTKMKDEKNVLVGTNVDKDDQMRAVSSLLRPSIRQLTKDHKPGEILAQVDLDPYHRSFRNVCTHVIANERLDEAALRKALKQGNAYVAHDWMCDPTGFAFLAKAVDQPSVIMGSELKFKATATLSADFPLACKIRLIRDGKAVAEANGDHFEHVAEGPGVYRVEGWLKLDGELRPWIYSNPIYLR